MVHGDTARLQAYGNYQQIAINVVLCTNNYRMAKRASDANKTSQHWHHTALPSLGQEIQVNTMSY